MDITLPAEWTAESLHDLFVSNGVARRLAARGPLFVATPPTPSRLFPGAPEHPTTECLEWVGCRSYEGYGYVRAAVLHGRANTSMPVHCLAYYLAVGPVPDEMDLGHWCENEPCARPDHVRPVTHVKNSRESAKRRWPDWLLAKAPPMRCPRAPGHGLMRATVQLYKDCRPSWAMACMPCGSAYKKGLREGIRLPTGRSSQRMNEEARRDVLAVLSGFMSDH